MAPSDVIAIIATVAILGAAIAYIIKAKKSGRKCIGCPDGCSCTKTGEGGCAGNCGSCGGSCDKD